MTIHRFALTRHACGFLLGALCAIGATILLPAWSAAQSPFLVKDIYTGNSSTPSFLTNVGGTLFFTAIDFVYPHDTGRELWKSDGTAAGTVLVKDIAAGRVGSIPVELTDVNGTLFFRIVRPPFGLWKSDGTAAGTVQV